MIRSTHLWRVVVLGLLWAGASAAQAQELFFVTGVSSPRAATLALEDETSVNLTLGRSVVPGVIRVADGQRLMLYTDPGVVTVVLGPAELVASSDELTGATLLEFRAGRMWFEARGMDEGTPIVIHTVGDDTPVVDVEFTLADGHTYVARDGARMNVGYLDGASEGRLLLAVNQADVPVASGQVLSVEGDREPSAEPLAPWLAERGFDSAAARDLCVASAHDARAGVEASLFQQIIAWDRYAGATYVTARLKDYRFNPEIRQTVQAITTTTRSTSRSGQTETQPFDAANEVPLLSPASASVQNLRDIGAGVTALQLNSNAASLLQSTGSRGLGFRGLTQLAIPGITDQGLRTVGPAGLAAP
ncbi:MAG: hypothetical protein JXO22_07960 [Phycisphaerae bacterium]|nr:hypothetical protein [Phycisphaerae bacterium]